MQLDDVVVSSSWQDSAAVVTTPEVPSGAPAEDETAAAETAADSETADDEREQQAEPETDEKPRKKGGFQRRIDQLTSKNRELEERLNALAGKPAVEAEPALKPTDSERPKAENFQTWEEYEDAALEWKAKEIAQRTEADKAKAEAAERAKSQQKRFTDGVAQVREKYADFDDLVNDDVQMTLAMRDVILDSDCGAELLYALAKDPTETERISKLGPLAAARELGKIEARISAVTPPAKPRVSAAAAPVRPLKATAAPVKVDLESADYETYKSARQAGRKR